MLISIITINYNNADSLAETFKSVLNQTFSDYEYIIIDGASTDNSINIIKEYEPLFNGKMKWVSEPDDGISDAFNKGIKMAKGKIIGIINSGDYYSTNALEIVALNYDKTKFDLFYGDGAKVNENGDIYSYTKAKAWEEIFSGINFLHSSCFVTKITYEQIGLFKKEFKIAMDIDLLLRIYKNKKKIVYENKLISFQVIGGISHQFVIQGFKESKTAALNYFPAKKYNIIYNYYLRIVKYFFAKIITKIGLRKQIKSLINR